MAGLISDKTKEDEKVDTVDEEKAVKEKPKRVNPFKHKTIIVDGQPIGPGEEFPG
jgi:hypothetical protein